MTTDKSPQDWMDDNVNIHSPTFCGAKWYNATIWLGNGMTASCHHPPPHRIDAEEVKKNPRALHNTHYKKVVRKEMQEGIQTRECEYCWKIEGIKDNDVVSDRYYKSNIYSKEDLDKAFNTPWNQDVSLKTLEIAFDNNCNFACSYCNAGFSTTWAHDINKNGAYQDLKSDGWGAYAHNGQWAQPYGPKNKDNPYVEAFWKWWEDELQYTLSELRVTGGEPSSSKEFWKLIDWYEVHPECNVRLAVNSNLGVKPAAIDRLIQSSKFIDNFILFTSNESYGKNAEYIRDGMIWDTWLDNMRLVCSQGNFNEVHVMMTLNALCLGSLDKFHDEMFNLRETTNTQITFSYNILRFPSFQSITTLPDDIRKERAEHYKTWLEQSRSRMKEHEIHGMKRLIAYIENITEGHSVRQLGDLATRQHDFKNFYTQYSRRRNKSLSEYFSNWPEMIEWVSNMGETHKNELNDLVTGDAVEWGAEIVNEVLEKHDKRSK